MTHFTTFKNLMHMVTTLAYSYFHGTIYEYVVTNVTDPIIQELNCTFSGNHTGTVYIY